MQGACFDHIFSFFLQLLVSFSRRNYYATGVNQLGYKDKGLFYDTSLFMHELGHNMGFAHDSSGSYIMKSTIQHTDVFSPQSIVRTRVSSRFFIFAYTCVGGLFCIHLQILSLTNPVTCSGLQQHLVHRYQLQRWEKVYGECSSFFFSICEYQLEYFSEFFLGKVSLSPSSLSSLLIVLIFVSYYVTL